jgi:membrane-associated protease RseP (regulator of RpoE activity)
MTICRACSSEITGPDRFCRNCGVQIAPTVAEFDDTRRFNPSSPLQSVPNDTTNPLSATQPPVLQGPAQGSAKLQRTASLVRTLLKRKLIWGLIILLFAASIGLGIGIGSSINHRRPVELQDVGEERDGEEDEETARNKFEEAVQNALGFKQGSFSAAEFPDVQGIFVNNLMSDDSPAALAGIQAGDLLTELNNNQVRNDSELSQALNALKTGDEVPVRVYRDGALTSSRIKIADRTFPPLQPKTDSDDQGFLGVLDSSRRCCIPGTKRWGVEVNELQVNGPAELFGLRVGDVITEFNGFTVKTPNEFNRRIRAVKPRSKVPLTFYRGNAQVKIEVIIGHRW